MLRAVHVAGRLGGVALGGVANKKQTRVDRLCMSSSQAKLLQLHA
jgi:septum formation inhibitor MinC